MRWQDMITEDDTRASQQQSWHRREVRLRRAASRRRLRLLLLAPALVGLVLLGQAVVYDGVNMGLQTFRVAGGTALLVPLLATWEW